MPDFNDLLALAFGAWAGVVGWLGHGIRLDLGRIGRELRAESDKLNQYIIATERRIAVLEDRLLRTEKEKSYNLGRREARDEKIPDA